MNFLEGFNGVSNSGPTQAQRGQELMPPTIQHMPNAPLQGQGMGGQQSMMGPYGGSPYAPLGGQVGASGPYMGTPWQTQPMQSPGLADPFVGALDLAQQQYLPAGTSPNIPEFDPKVPGGGMHQQQLGGNAPAPAAPFAPAAPQRYEMVKNPWTGKATSDNAGFDPMEGYSIQPVVRNPNSRINYNSPIYQRMMASNR